MKPTPMALVLPSVAGSWKKTMPLSASGSLLSAPTIEYVVDDVARMHHAVVYEMKTAHAPEKMMAAKSECRVSGGLWECKLGGRRIASVRSQVAREILGAPILDELRCVSMWASAAAAGCSPDS